MPRATDEQSRSSLHPKVIAIVLNWNGWLDTVECIESLLRSDAPPTQIVICDNGSVDGSVDRLREWAEGVLIADLQVQAANGRWSYSPVSKPLSYTIISQSEAASTSSAHYGTDLLIITLPENLGYAGGNNVGMRYALDRASADFVWLLNNDTVVDRYALGRMLALAAISPRLGIVGAKLLQYARPDRLQAYGGGHFTPAFAFDTQIGSGRKDSAGGAESHELGHVIGASMLVRAPAIHDVGGFDETYFLYREETDWSVRMRQNNWRLICCSGAIVWHKQGTSLGLKTPLHDYYSVRNMLRLVRKYYPSAFPVALFTIAARSILPKLARLQFRRLEAVLLAFRDFFAHRDGRAHTDQQLLESRKQHLKR
jgi:GT2 family glycosyltransferase